LCKNWNWASILCVQTWNSHQLRKKELPKPRTDAALLRIVAFVYACDFSTHAYVSDVFRCQLPFHAAASRCACTHICLKCDRLSRSRRQVERDLKGEDECQITEGRRAGVTVLTRSVNLDSLSLTRFSLGFRGGEAVDARRSMDVSRRWSSGSCLPELIHSVRQNLSCC
jgi:hypothetical protein